MAKLLNSQGQVAVSAACSGACTYAKINQPKLFNHLGIGCDRHLCDDIGTER